ncbi:MAG: SUMF1/EgtB/PvdO family nonheme iron enzyme [Nitrospinaceae bacterium]
MICLAVLLSACRGDGPEKGPALPPIKISEIDGKEMVWVPAGEFIMGTDKTDPENTHQQIGAVKPLYLDQHPERKIHLDAFYIDKLEVTNREFKKFIDSAQYGDQPMNWEEGNFPEGEGEHPVTHVIWNEALTYCLWAGKQLPTEAQWEKAARGPQGLHFPWGNEYEKGRANIGTEAARKSAPVGSYPGDIGPYGALDMAGNVMEWTADWFRPYPGNPNKDPRFGKRLKVLRGNGFQKAGHYFLEAYRYSFARTEADPDSYYENVGFRCSARRGANVLKPE